MKSIYLAVLTLAQFALDGAAVQERCIPLKASERARLETYVRKKFKVPATLAIRINEAQGQECSSFRKLDVTAVDPAKKFKLVLYASSDLRFLTRDLLDTRIDPDLEARQREHEFQAGLSNGAFPVLGPASAPATITVFSDFQCPYCARFAHMLRKDVLPRDSSGLRVVFREFPLQMHPWARSAAESAVCLSDQGNDFFWKMHDYIFENQRDFSVQNVRAKIRAEASRIRGFNAARFDTCLADPKTSARVEADVAFGTKNGIRGTPSVFVNGKRISVTEPEQLLSVIREAKAASAEISRVP